MAMNKKEQAEFERLKQEVRLAKALRWTEPVGPDVPIPDRFSDLTKGFLFHAYLGGFDDPRVDVACSSSIHHSFGNNNKTTTQGARRLYSTRLRALKGLRYEVEKLCAKALAEIDRQIEEESDQEQSI